MIFSAILLLWWQNIEAGHYYVLLNFQSWHFNLVYVLGTEWGRARDREDLLCLGRERAERLLPIFLSAYGATLVDFEGKTCLTSRQSAAELWRSGAEEQRCQKTCQKPPWICSNSLHKIIKDVPWHLWAWGVKGSHRNLESCSNALTGSSILELSCFVPYGRHVINPLNLRVPNAWLKERKDLIQGLTPQVDFLASLGMKFSLQRLVRLFGRNGNQETWAWLKEETGKGWCNFRAMGR